MQEGLLHGPDAAEGGHSDNGSKGSGGVTGGKSTENLGELQKTKKDIPTQNLLQKDGKRVENTGNLEEKDFPMDQML